MNSPILLSGPDVGDDERQALLAAFDSGWIAPAGPDLAAFEQELADYTGAEACVALASGTAALHLGLLELGVGPGDEVVVQTATFAASAFAVTYTGAKPVFCDIDPSTWTIDPAVLDEFLAARAKVGRLPKAVMPVDLYGSCADYDALIEVCGRYEVPLVEDGAEGLGSVYRAGRMAGSFGDAAAVSFNGNKIITTSGGGALLGPTELVERVRYRSTQARQPALHYEHTEIGFNYRLSNLLAGLGRAQLANLEAKIERRRQINERYRTHPDLAALSWCPYAATERPNHWLSVAILPDGVAPAGVCEQMLAEQIEARPAWKPMHLQPVFADAEMVGGAVSEQLFDRGLCLPSGSGLSLDDEERVHAALAKALAADSP